MTPSPTTDATTCFGNMSATIANRLAAQPMWAAAAKLMRMVATQILDVCVATNTGTTLRAHTSRTDLRLALTDQPRRNRNPDSQPEPMLPTEATM